MCSSSTASPKIVVCVWVRAFVPSAVFSKSVVVCCCYFFFVFRLHFIFPFSATSWASRKLVYFKFLSSVFVCNIVTEVTSFSVSNHILVAANILSSLKGSGGSRWFEIDTLIAATMYFLILRSSLPKKHFKKDQRRYCFTCSASLLRIYLAFRSYFTTAFCVCLELFIGSLFIKHFTSLALSKHFHLLCGSTGHTWSSLKGHK